MFDYREFIERNPKICGGHPVFKGTRVLLRSILSELAAGYDSKVITEQYPTLNENHVRAAIAFAADSARDDLPVSAVPNI